MTGDPNPPDPWMDASFPHHAYVGSLTNQGGAGPWDAWNQNPSFHANASNNAPCPTCGMYYQDDAFSTDASSDDGSSMPAGSNVDPSEAYQEYAFARKKRRRISCKFPTSYCRLGKGARGGKPSYASFLPPQAFAGGKRWSLSKGLFKKENPKDKYGQVMRSNACQSDEHLWRKCLKPPQQGGSFATGSASVPSAHAHALMNTPQPQQQLALMPANQSLMWGNSANASLPGVHFFCTGMEQLRSISDAGSVVSASSRKRSSEHAEATAPDNPSKAVPKFSPGFFQVHPALHLAIHQGLHPAKHPMLHPSVKHPVVFPSPEVERLIEGASDPQSPPPTRPPKITSSRLGVSGSTAADNADMPKTDMSGCAN